MPVLRSSPGITGGGRGWGRGWGRGRGRGGIGCSRACSIARGTGVPPATALLLGLGSDGILLALDSILVQMVVLLLLLPPEPLLLRG
jgi:hypothetical protein